MKTWLGGVLSGGLIVSAVLLAGSVASLAQRFTNPHILAPSYPTPQTIVDQMLAIAQVKPGENVYDLGCGDGRIVITAARQFKAKAVGIEIRPEIYAKTAAKVAELGLSDQVKIVQGDALGYDLSGADVVTLYLLTSSNERLKPTLLHYLKHSARVVSHDFEIRGWKAAQMEKMTVGGQAHTIYLYQISDNLKK